MLFFTQMDNLYHGPGTAWECDACKGDFIMSSDNVPLACPVCGRGVGYPPHGKRESEHMTGLERRFVVLRGGEPVSWPSFVLRIDGKDPAAMEALRTYALATDDHDLAVDLAAIVDRDAPTTQGIPWRRQQAVRLAARRNEDKTGLVVTCSNCSSEIVPASEGHTLLADALERAAYWGAVVEGGQVFCELCQSDAEVPDA